MDERKFSRMAILGFTLPFATALAVAICTATIPMRYMDHGWGVVIGVIALGLFILGLLVCSKAIHNIKQHQNTLQGYVVARVGQLLPIVTIVGLVITYVVLRNT